MFHHFEIADSCSLCVCVCVCVRVQDKLVFVCSLDCSLEFKKANYVTCLCEYCKMEKIIRDSKRINKKDCFFCSDGEKTLCIRAHSERWFW